MGAYPPTDAYAKPFYCSTLGLNMKSSQMHWKIINWAMRIYYLSKCLSIQYKQKDCRQLVYKHCYSVFTSLPNSQVEEFLYNSFQGFPF